MPPLNWNLGDLWYGVCLVVPLVLFPALAVALLWVASLLRARLAVWWGVVRPADPAPAAVIPEPFRAPCPVLVPVPVGDGDALSAPTTRLIIALLSANRGHNLTLTHLARLTNAAERALPADPTEDSPAQGELREQIAVARGRYQLARLEEAV